MNMNMNSKKQDKKIILLLSVKVLSTTPQESLQWQIHSNVGMFQYGTWWPHVDTEVLKGSHALKINLMTHGSSAEQNISITVIWRKIYNIWY